MLGSHLDQSAEETSHSERASAAGFIKRMVSLLAPTQRVILSVFLFLDVCIICFGCLLIFEKIGLPF
jgi:hypothetical protein